MCMLYWKCGMESIKNKWLTETCPQRRQIEVYLHNEMLYLINNVCIGFSRDILYFVTLQYTVIVYYNSRNIKTNINKNPIWNT